MENQERLARALADRYTIEGEVGSGGMATVYLGEDLKHRRKVAIKVLRPELSSSVGAQRFLREIQIAATISHPHVLPLFDSGEAEGLLFYVMPFVEGESLRDRLNREHQLPVEEALRITSQVAAALGQAHQQGIVHRDIKPENILLSGGEAVVADFGIAGAVELAGGERMTATGMAIGTPVYMSPEQAGGRSDLGPRSDIYSLGCVLYEMLLGDPPFMGSTAEAILARKLTEPAQKLRSVRETVPPGVEQVTLKALARLPADRFTTAEEFAIELERSPTLIVEEVPRLASGFWVRKGLALAAILTVAGILTWWAMGPMGDGPTIPILAVLLPGDVLDDPQEELFVLAVHDGVNLELTMLGLPVQARESMMLYRGTERPLREVADDLRVEVFIGLAVLRVGESQQVHARLIDGETERQIWAGSYEAGSEGLALLVSSIVAGIAEEVQGPLTPEQEARLNLVRQWNTQAYEAYLKGTASIRAVRRETLETAEQYFLQAIEIDSTFAPAVAALSRVHTMRGAFAISLPSEEIPVARALALRAIQLDSTISESHAALAMIHRWDRERELEGQRWERAIALNPQNPDSHAGYSYLLQLMGRLDEAIAEYRRATELEPLHTQYNKELARILYFARRHDEALAQSGRALALDPTDWGAHLHRSLILVQLGKLDEAVEEIERSFELSGQNPGPVGFVAYVYAHVGREGEARALLEEGERQRGRPGGAASAIAYGALGEIEKAFSCLDVAYENNSSWLWQLNDPIFDSLRDDPRFDQLLLRLGLQQQEG